MWLCNSCADPTSWKLGPKFYGQCENCGQLKHCIKGIIPPNKPLDLALGSAGQLDVTMNNTHTDKDLYKKRAVDNVIQLETKRHEKNDAIRVQKIKRLRQIFIRHAEKFRIERLRWRDPLG